MPARERLTVIVLGDGAREAALGSALAARPHAARVLVAERDALAARTAAERALPEDVAVLECDWNDPALAEALLAEVDSDWALFLAAGEALACSDRDALEREFAGLPPGPVSLSAGARRETRLHPPTASALAAVGQPSGVTLESLRVVPLPAGIGRRPRAAAPAPAARASRVIPGLPPQLQDEARLAAAIEGRDLAALEQLCGVLERHEEQRLLGMARAGRDVCWTDEGETEPLVTIRIATYHRPELIGRAIESCLRQTYERIEVLVVGDHCTEETAAEVQRFRDPRLRFVNLPSRGMYPAELMARWRVAGVWPANAALMLGQGSWITACDDDDEFTPDHVATLLTAARAGRHELVYSVADMETAPGRWERIGSEPLREGHVTQGSVLYSMGLRFLRFSNTCWRRERPADFDLWSRMQAIGVRMGFVDQVTYRHGLETHQRVRAQAG